MADELTKDEEAALVVGGIVVIGGSAVAIAWWLSQQPPGPMCEDGQTLTRVCPDDTTITTHTCVNEVWVPTGEECIGPPQPVEFSWSKISAYESAFPVAIALPGYPKIWRVLTISGNIYIELDGGNAEFGLGRDAELYVYLYSSAPVGKKYIGSINLGTDLGQKTHILGFAPGVTGNALGFEVHRTGCRGNLLPVGTCDRRIPKYWGSEGTMLIEGV